MNFSKWVGFRSGRPDHGAAFLDHELDPVTGSSPRRFRISCGTVTWPLLLIVLELLIFTLDPYSKDTCFTDRVKRFQLPLCAV